MGCCCAKNKRPTSEKYASLADFTSENENIPTTNEVSNYVPPNQTSPTGVKFYRNSNPPIPRPSDSFFQPSQDPQQQSIRESESELPVKMYDPSLSEGLPFIKPQTYNQHHQRKGTIALPEPRISELTTNHQNQNQDQNENQNVNIDQNNITKKSSFIDPKFIEFKDWGHNEIENQKDYFEYLVDEIEECNSLEEALPFAHIVKKIKQCMDTYQFQNVPKVESPPKTESKLFNLKQAMFFNIRTFNTKLESLQVELNEARIDTEFLRILKFVRNCKRTVEALGEQ